MGWDWKQYVKPAVDSCVLESCMGLLGCMFAESGRVQSDSVRRGRDDSADCCEHKYVRTGRGQLNGVDPHGVCRIKSSVATCSAFIGRTPFIGWGGWVLRPSGCITQRVVVIRYRRFGKTSWFHLQGPWIQGATVYDFIDQCITNPLHLHFF